jgi:hypothetical protein
MRYHGEPTMLRLAEARMAEGRRLAASPLLRSGRTRWALARPSFLASQLLCQAGSRLVKLGKRLECYSLKALSSAG